MGYGTLYLYYIYKDIRDIAAFMLDLLCNEASTFVVYINAILKIHHTPSQPTRAPVPVSVCSWLSDSAHFDHAPPTISSQTASAADTVTDTTDNLLVLIVYR